MYSVHCTLTIFSSFGRRFYFSYTAFAINHASLMFWQYTMYNVMYNCTMYNIHGKWGCRKECRLLLKQYALFSTHILRWARMSVLGTVSWFQHHQLDLYHHLLKTSSKPLDLVVCGFLPFWRQWTRLNGAFTQHEGDLIYSSETC